MLAYWVIICVMCSRTLLTVLKRRNWFATSTRAVAMGASCTTSSTASWLPLAQSGPSSLSLMAGGILPVDGKSTSFQLARLALTGQEVRQSLGAVCIRCFITIHYSLSHCTYSNFWWSGIHIAVCVGVRGCECACSISWFANCPCVPVCKVNMWLGA